MIRKSTKVLVIPNTWLAWFSARATTALEPRCPTRARGMFDSLEEKKCQGAGIVQ